MTIVLRLTDGTTTVNLHGGAQAINLAEPYAPVAPDIETAEAVSMLRDGGVVTAALQRNVTESCVVAITGSSYTTVQTALHSVELLLAQAVQRSNTGKGPQVWVEYAAESSGGVYRSELLYGRAQVDRETATEGWIADSALRVVIGWQRRFYWEGNLIQLSLKNTAYAVKTAGGIVIYNHSDGGHDNWVDIVGTDIAGVLPTPLMIKIYNSYNVAARTYKVYAAGNTFAAPTTLAHILEGEAAATVAGSAAPTADATSSAGYYQTATWAGSTETAALTWTLNAAYMAATQGYRFRLLARVFSTASSGLRVRPKLLFAGLTALWTGAYTTITYPLSSTSTIQDLGVVQLPPWLEGRTDLYEITLGLYGIRTGGATLDLDFVQVTPLDGYRYFYPQGYGLPYLSFLVDDGPAGQVYVDYGATGKAGYYNVQGQVINAYPGRDLRLYFLASNDYGSMTIARTHVILVYYRPRVLSV